MPNSTFVIMLLCSDLIMWVQQTNTVSQSLDIFMKRMPIMIKRMKQGAAIPEHYLLQSKNVTSLLTQDMRKPRLHFILLIQFRFMIGP